MDGKTVRGARTSEEMAPHLLACLDHVPGWSGQVQVDGEDEEITMFAACWIRSAT